jgi:hypothetical protein
MPPRHSACTTLATTPAVQDAATTALWPLPLPLVLHIFSLLPVDVRLRCCEVCRGWRSFLSERSLWTRLDVSATSGVRTHQRHNALDALLRCAAARSGGGLQSLHINSGFVSHETLLEVAAANASALRELHAHDYFDEIGFTPADEVVALLAAAPRLRVFATDMYSDYSYTGETVEATRRALRNEAPFGPLRVRRLCADLRDVDETGVVAFAAEVAAHASLRALRLGNAWLNTAASLDAVVDAALARRVQTVAVDGCRLSPASAPALARLLSSDALTTLECRYSVLLDAPAAAVLAAALRANSTLTSLTLNHVRVFDDSVAAAELLSALSGHASLRLLSLRGNYAIAAHQAAAGASLGALLAANARLTQLDVSFCALGNAGLRPLLAALPHNTHLRTLNVSSNGFTQAFARDVLLPALRVNTSLRSMGTFGSGVAVADIERELRSRAPL